jgi:hypothetical protein
MEVFNMKMKKVLSLLTAAAMGASCMAGMAFSASADTSTTYTWDFTSSTFFPAEIKSGNDIISDQGETTAIMSNPGAKFSRNTSSVKDSSGNAMQCVKTEATASNAMKLVIPDGDKATLSIQLTSGSSGQELYIRDSEGNALITAKDYTKNVLGDHDPYSTDVTCGETYYLDTTNYKAYVGKVVLTVTSSSGEESTDPSIALDNKELALTAGDTEQLKATVKNADGATINWTSDNEDVATVDQAGNVTAVAAGEATIKAELEGEGYDGYSDSCKVTVSEKVDYTPVAWVSEGAVTAGQALVDENSITITSNFDAAANMGFRYNTKAYSSSTNIRIDKASFTEKSGSTYLIVEPKTSGDLTLTYRRQEGDVATDSYVAADGKDIHLTTSNTSDSTKVAPTSFNVSGEVASVSDASATAYRTVRATYALEAGTTYYISARGTTIALAEIDFLQDPVDPEGELPTVTYGADNGKLYNDNTDTPAAKAYTATVNTGSFTLNNVYWYVTVDGRVNPESTADEKPHQNVQSDAVATNITGEVVVGLVVSIGEKAESDPNAGLTIDSVTGASIFYN